MLTTYAIVAFMGVRNSIVDVAVGMANWVRVPVARSEATSTQAGPTSGSDDLDWESVLYFGPGVSDSGRGVRGQGAAVTTRPPRAGERRSRVRMEVSS